MGLEKTNEWLDSEAEILKKMPLLQRDQIKVRPDDSARSKGGTEDRIR